MRALALLCALGAALPAIGAPESSDRIGHAHSSGADTVSALREMLDRLGDPDASVKTLLPHLGRVERRQGDAGYDIVPLNAHFFHIFLGLYPREWQKAETGRSPVGESPYYLDVLMGAGTHLQVADLGAAFGVWRRGVPAPEGNPFVILFDHPGRLGAASPYDVQMRVYLSGPPERPETQVKEVTITRERMR